MLKVEWWLLEQKGPSYLKSKTFTLLEFLWNLLPQLARNSNVQQY